MCEVIGSLPEGRPLVDLVLSGHAHCLEYLRTGNTGHADSHINWIICGGSGFSLRRQRREGPELMETFDGNEDSTRKVARSLLYIGRSGRGSQKRRPYSFYGLMFRMVAHPSSWSDRLSLSGRNTSGAIAKLSRL